MTEGRSRRVWLSMGVGSCTALRVYDRPNVLMPTIITCPRLFINRTDEQRVVIWVMSRHGKPSIMTLPLSHIHRRIARISTGIRSQGGVGKSLLINGLCGQMLATAVKPLRKGCSCFSLLMLSYN